MKGIARVFLIAAIASGSVLGIANFGMTHAESSMPKPSVPEFSLKLVRYSSEQPAVYGLDPYTGENITIIPPKYQEHTEIVITIVNQPFTPYKDSNGNWIELYYRVRSKGHFSNNWEGSGRIVEAGPQNSSLRVVTFPADYYSPNAQIDFQIQAMIGYVTQSAYPMPYRYETVFEALETSQWSSTQTITIDDSVSATTPDTSPAQNPTEPLNQSNTQSAVTQSGLGWTEVGLLLVVGVVFVLLIVNVVYLRKKRAFDRVAQS